MRTILILFYILKGLVPASAVSSGYSPEHGTVLLHYLNVRDKYYLLAVCNRTAQLYPLPAQHTIDSLTDRYLFSIHQRRTDRRCGYRLRAALLPEVVLTYPRLVISAEGALSRLPFECLPADSTNQASYLLDRSTIHYVRKPSDWLKPSHEHPPATGNKSLALAPDFSHSGLSSLPYASREIRGSDPRTGQTLVSEDLSRQQFLNLVPAYDLLHIATHTRSDTGLPAANILYLSPTDSVWAGEIRSLKLDMQLLVLSACHSAISLAPAFLDAGTHNVLAATWEIPDKSSSTIITSFFRHLRNGCEKARALQLAKLDYLRGADAQGIEPYYWAGLILYGDRSAIQLQGPDPKKALWLDISACILAGALVYLRKKYIPEGRGRSG